MVPQTSSTEPDSPSEAYHGGNAEEEEWYQHLLTLFAIFVTSEIPELRDFFRIMFVFYVYGVM